jgi:CopG family nickel-responsive transcriptional regulator
MENPRKASRLVSRISISMDHDLLKEIDWMAEKRGFQSRSQAVSDMAHAQLVDYKHQLGNNVMAGTITLLYDRSVRGLQKKLSDIQYRNIDEVISSLHVHLEEDKLMEVLLVQGPTARLQAILDSMVSLKGVITGRLQLLAAVIPPIHQRPGDAGTGKRKPGARPLVSS